MIKRLVFAFFLIILLTHITLADDYKAFYSLIIHYNNGDLSAETVKLVEGLNPTFNEEGLYSLTLLSFEETVLFSYTFEIPLIKMQDAPLDWFDEEGKQIIIPESKENIEETSISKTLFIPYFPNAKEIIIQKEGQVNLIIDISELALCNQNKICDIKESEELCPDDCSQTNTFYRNLSFWQRIIYWIASLFR